MRSPTIESSGRCKMHEIHNESDHGHRAASHRCRAAASIYDMEGAFVIHRSSFKRPSGLIEHERNSGSRSRFEPGQLERGESILSTLSVNSHLIANYFPQMKSESAAIFRDHLTWTTMDHVSFGLTAQLLVCYETPRLGRRAAIPSEIKSLERTNRSLDAAINLPPD